MNSWLLRTARYEVGGVAPLGVKRGKLEAGKLVYAESFTSEQGGVEEAPYVVPMPLILRFHYSNVPHSSTFLF